MTCEIKKIDSNVTGLRFAEEDCLAELPASPTWYGLEPNSYSDFGGQITTTPRNPINDSRQRKKGPTTDLDASGGFNNDLTQKNLQRILQGFVFADMRLKADTEQDLIGRLGGNVPVIDVDGTAEEYTLSNLEVDSVDSVAAGGSGYVAGDVLTFTGGTFSTAGTITVLTAPGGAVATVEITNPGRYSVAPSDPVSVSGGSGTGATFNLTFAAVSTYLAGDLFVASGFAEAANNGLKTIVTVTGDTVIEVAEDVVDETPTSDAIITVVGFQFDAGDAEIDASGSLPQLITTTKDLEELGLVPGEPVFIGGDVAAASFATAADNGYKRVRSIDTNSIVLDKSTETMVTDAGAAKTIQVFFGRVLKNESGTLIKRRSYNLERTLGAPDADLPSEIQSEYLVGSVPNEMTLNVDTADKVTVDLSFISTDHETRDGATGVKSGSRPDIVEADAFNTSSDFARIKLATVSDVDEAPTALFAFVTDLNVSINNNASPNKAVGVLGAFEVTAGTFEVGGSLTAYFADVAAIAAVRANTDVTLDMFMVHGNAGVSIDLPLIGLGNGRLNVEQDQPITLPLDTPAYDGAKVNASLDHTLLVSFFQYLPDAATPA